MTKALALEWGPLGICVNAIAPGSFRTDLTKALYDDPARSARIVDRIPLGRPGEPADWRARFLPLPPQLPTTSPGPFSLCDGGIPLLVQASSRKRSRCHSQRSEESLSVAAARTATG